MYFNQINLETWPRKEIYHHFLKQGTSYSITTDIDITKLYQNIKVREYKFYPVLIYMIMKVVNSNESFRMSLDQDGNLGYWETMNPLYTVFDDETELFSGIWTLMDDTAESGDGDFD